MSSTACELLSNGPQPQPIYITYRDGLPVSEVIVVPEGNPLTAAAAKAARKAATSERLRQETTATKTRIQQHSQTYGPDGKLPSPVRLWNSRRPNQNYLEAVVSGVFGNATNLEKAYWDREAFEEAQAAADGWRWKPWKGFVWKDQVWVETIVCSKDGERRRIEGHWEPVAAQRDAARVPETPLMPENVTARPLVSAWLTESAITRRTKDREEKPSYATRITNEVVNEVYANYLLNPAAELGNLEVALFAFAPAGGRRNDCYKLLGGGGTSDEIFIDFGRELLRRILRGQYPTHDGRLHKWISMVWKQWFFPDYETAFYKASNLHFGLNQFDEFDDDGGEVSAADGRVNPVDVDREQMVRDIEGWNNPSRLVDRLIRDLDNPSTYWGQLSLVAKSMIRSLAQGASKTAAAEGAGVGARQGRKVMEGVAELAEQHPEMWEHLFISGSSVDVSL